MKLSKTYNLRVDNPGLADQWHPVKNRDLRSEDVTPGSNKKVWWVCQKGHEWQAVVNGRTNGSGCPYCSGRRANKDNCLKTKNPELAGQWHPVKNNDLTPEDVTPGSSKKVWWVCQKGHEWQELVAGRTNGYGCPYCSGRRVDKDNSLKVKNPEIARQWHPVKNGDLKPEDVSPGSRKKAWWVCDKGHEWQAMIRYRTVFKTRCPYCLNKSAEYELTISNPVIAKMWHPEKNGNLTPADVTANSVNNVWWLCEKGHEWQDRRLVCPLCHKEKPIRKKFRYKVARKTSRGPHKPIVKKGIRRNYSSYYLVATKLEEKMIIRDKGKISKVRKITTYARYVYGLDRIPDGWVIWHIDGDPLNNNIENLECISREEQLRRVRKMKKGSKNP